jgi:hypothetical protein
VKSGKTGWLISAALATGISLAPAATMAQLFGQPQAAPPPAQSTLPRTVSGAVLDAADKPIVGATVFIKSLKTKSIRSFTTVEKGHYYFAQVNKTDDFELWAELNGKKSAVKTVSSWDSRTQFVSDLKIK